MTLAPVMVSNLVASNIHLKIDPHHGVQYPTGKNLKSVWAEFPTLS
jgi:hypothetical protein